MRLSTHLWTGLVSSLIGTVAIRLCGTPRQHDPLGVILL